MKKGLSNTKYVISVSYGNYITGTGGTDKVIKAHQELLNRKNISYMFLYPIKNINKKWKVKEEYWGCVCDGVDEGIFSTASIVKYVKQLQEMKYCMLSYFIHHFNKVSIHELKSVTNLYNAPIYIYLHDYMTICPGAGLITSSDTYCGCSFPEEKKCNGCTYFNHQQINKLFDISEFFKSYCSRLIFIAPSDAAKTEWIKCYPEYEEKVRVIYHQTKTEHYKNNIEEINNHSPLKVAFVGYQKNLKGWYQWRDAVNAAKKKGCNIEFFQFGTVKDHFEYIKEVNVDFKQNLTAMIDALRENKIHVAVLWSIWPETYSYTFYESWAANTFVLCNELSGNIKDQVRIQGNGLVCSAPNDLEDILVNEEYLRELVNDFRKKEKFGPLYLDENEELLDLVNNNPKFPICNDETLYSRNFIQEVFYNFLYKVNKLYQKKIKRRK